MSPSLRQLLGAGGAFQGYAYAYPHKTAYRPLQPPRSLAELWAPEDKSSLFLYAHLPFCDMRCGFCNLFTTSHPDAGLAGRYLDALERQAEAVAVALGSSARFHRLAVGGGTPTFLSLPELKRLFGILNTHFPGAASGIPKAIEASPATVDAEKLTFLKEQGITRVSLGVQSFIESEVRALGRAQRTQDVRQALGALLAAGFKCVNVDLIYGMTGQTVSSWQYSLQAALEFAPQELYLYPLYVRPLTGLGQMGDVPADNRLELYRAGRQLLLQGGYQQVSMRLFRRASYSPPEGPVYCCQEDGMVGLGAGARSYTRALHYSTEYAVGRAGVMQVISDFTHRTRDQFAYADYGCELGPQEQRRRHVLKSLLRVEGLDLAAYQRCFATDVFADLPELLELSAEGLAAEADGHLRLNARGLELSDAIGPWLWSSEVRQKMGEFALS